MKQLPLHQLLQVRAVKANEMPEVVDDQEAVNGNMNRLELLEDRLKAECADQNGGPEALDAALKQLPLLQLLLARAVKANKKPDVEKKEYVC